MTMPILRSLSKVPLRASSLLQPVTESLTKGVQRGLYTYTGRDKRYALTTAEKARIMRRLDVTAVLGDIVDTIVHRESSSLHR
jgi:hypothetical protein